MGARMNEAYKIVKAAEKRGWIVVITKSGWLLRYPGGGTANVHKTTSDHRGLKNFQMTLARVERAAALAKTGG